MSRTVNVVLLCRNSIVREGLSRILSERDFHVAQSASCSDDLIADEKRGDIPQLILIDNGVEDGAAGTISTLQSIFPASHLVMLSDRFDFQSMLKAFQLGIRGYIVKDISCDRLCATLQLVAMGERVLPSQLADELQARPELVATSDADLSADTASLSEREREILRWLIMGCPNKVISRRMEISEATVKVHVKAVLRKLSVKNRTQAAIWAANHGMRGRCYEVEPAPLAHIPHPAQLPAAGAMTAMVAHG